MLKKIFNNDYLLSIFNKIIVIITGLFSSIFLTRYLGLVDKGIYSYVLQVISIATIVLNMGIPQSYSYFYRKNKGNIYNEFLNIYTLQFILLIIIFLWSNFMLDEGNLFKYIFFLLPFSTFSQLMESTMAVENIRLKIIVHVFDAILKVILFMLMFLFIPQSIFVPLLITAFIYGLTVIVYIKSQGKKPKPHKVDFSKLGKIINYSWLPMLTQLLVLLNYSNGIIFLRHLGSEIDLGIYSTAIGIVNYFWLIPDAFKEVLISRISRKHSEKSVLLAVKLSLIVIVFIIILFSIFGELALSVLYGAEFIGAYSTILILSFGVISMVFYKVIGVVVLAEGRRWYYFLSLIASVLISMVLNIFLIPRYGSYGAAFSSVISYTICGGAFLLYYIKYKNIKISEILFITKDDLVYFRNFIKR